MTTQRAGTPGPVAPARNPLPHAFRARLARILARRAVACALRRAELRARAFELIAADRRAAALKIERIGGAA